ncbi:hypothetical protein VTK26DRAFT_9046 [Humicola hyalothermophila]
MGDRETGAPLPESIAMEASSSTTPASASHRLPSAEQAGTKPGADATPTTAHVPDGRVLDGEFPVVRTGKDMLDDPHIERRDTTESWVSDFSSHRTNTGWSIAASTMTDMTDPLSPDVAFVDTTTEPEDAPSPRHGSLACPPISLPKRLPIRAPSMPSSDPDKPRTPRYGSSPDGNMPALRHRRVEEIAARRPSPGRQPGQAIANMGSIPSSPRASNPSVASDAQTWDRASGNAEPSSHHGRVIPSVPTIPSSSTTEAGGANEDDEANSSKLEEGQLTPKTAEESSDEDMFVELQRSICSHVSGSSNDDDSGPAFKPDDDMIQDVAGQVLKHSFGLQLQDLTSSDAISAAYESVSFCLDELSRIVASSGCGDVGQAHVQRNLARRTGGAAGSGNIPIRPAASRGHGGSGNASGGSAPKRPNGGHDEDCGSGDGAGDGSPNGGKRQKVSSTFHQIPAVRMSCPFRKRNPVRFNVRDHQTCAVQSFPDISQVKRHVKNFHKQKLASLFPCPRCKQDLKTKEAYENHLAVDKGSMCDVREILSSAEPEDGITSQMEDMLNGRKTEDKINSWNGLWRLLFPDDKDRIPSPDFAPPIELDEVYAEFNSPDCVDGLRSQIKALFSPTEGGMDALEDLRVDSMLEIFKSHVESVFDACRSRTGPVTGLTQTTRPRLPRQISSPESSKKRIGGELPVREGRGLSIRSISAPEGTGTVLSHVEAGPGISLQPPGVTVGEDGAFEVPATTSGYGGHAYTLMAAVTVGESGSQNSQPITVPLAHGFAAGQGQLTATPLAGRHLMQQQRLQHQHRPLPSESGIGGLDAAFMGPPTRAAAAASARFPDVAPSSPFGPAQNSGYQTDVQVPTGFRLPIQIPHTSVQSHHQAQHMFAPATGPMVSPISPVQQQSPGTAFFPASSHGASQACLGPPEFVLSRRNGSGPPPWSGV